VGEDFAAKLRPGVSSTDFGFVRLSGLVSWLSRWKCGNREFWFFDLLGGTT